MRKKGMECDSLPFSARTMFIWGFFFRGLGLPSNWGKALIASSRQPIRDGGQSDANEVSIAGGATDEAWICG